MNNSNTAACRISRLILTVDFLSQCPDKRYRTFDSYSAFCNKTDIISGCDNPADRKFFYIQHLQISILNVLTYFICHIPVCLFKITVYRRTEIPEFLLVIFPGCIFVLCVQGFHSLSHCISINMYHSNKIGFIS